MVIEEILVLLKTHIENYLIVLGKDRTTITSSEFANTYQDSVAYWCDGAAGFRDDWKMARLQGGTLLEV